ncbi:hypothetical protein KP77_05830 [Jeotgalibacillus alimentarius]|uniref:Uncharacterized protein n=1 Tax=Jeotgalibacillus alimentarius TaxID=135826 RepID=A0A0C2W7K8_9BACL|nr:hypothetical protein [Jeotgalibacillus alimentarius]KIL52556.1 hypothetical protein KP77_05830 [Jeotgalibacillus alimentarius]
MADKDNKKEQNNKNDAEEKMQDMFEQGTVDRKKDDEDEEKDKD